MLFFSFGFLGIFVLGAGVLLGLSLGFYLFSYVGVDFYSEFVLDGVSSMCLLMLFFCGSVALFYCFHYFGGSLDGKLLFFLIVWFLSVMGGLVFSGGLVLSLVFWEYLGLVSFLLILFYSNGVSVRASLVTLFASRFGDVSFFILIMWGVRWLDFSNSVLLFLVLLIVMTKSASFPFISWLLEAMRAPTPVSSLVHSSTLVAAGVWFLLRYSSYFSVGSLYFLFFFCSLTVVLTGFCASFFMDLKKVVALSTCNNISWCVIFFICGDLYLCLFQLLTHGICKCFLFMSVGDLMSSSMGSQSSVNVFLSSYGGFCGVFGRVFLILSLSGLPFLGVFFSKHLFFSLVAYGFSWFGLALLFLGFVMTYCYSVRLVLMLVCSGVSCSFGYLSSFLFIIGLVLLGSVLNFVCVFFVGECFGLSLGFSVFLLVGQGFGCFLGWLLFVLKWGSLFWQSVLWGSDCLVSSVYSIFVPMSSLCVLGFYRWEVLSCFFGLSFLKRYSLLLGSSFFSFNFLVYGLTSVLFLYSFIL